MSQETAGSSRLRTNVRANWIRPIPRLIAYAILALELAFLLGSSCQRSTAPQGYSCVNQACTASVTFFGGTPGGDPILGYQSSIYLPAASGLSGGTASSPPVVAGGFLRNSLALNAGPTNGFVEAGYVTQGGSNLAECGPAGNFYFWTDFSSGNLVVKCLGTIPTQDFSSYVNVRILNLSDSGSTPTFLVSIKNQSTNFEPCTTTSPCSEPLWVPGSRLFASATFGQTLVGTSGAFANSASFINNSYQNATGPGHLSFQSADGTVNVGNPPLGEWITWPSQPLAANGGVFHTFCCQITTVFPGSLNFGTSARHSTSGPQSVMVSNTSSTDTLNIHSITISGTNSGDFAKTATNCGQTLAPLKSCTVTITFTPSTLGREDATLTIADSGGGGSGSDTAILFGYGQ